jgi:hypothetical protein
MSALFTKFDPRRFLESEEREGAPAKSAKPAKAIERSVAPAAPLAILAGLADHGATPRNIASASAPTPIPPETWADIQRERAAVIECDDGTLRAFLENEEQRGEAAKDANVANGPEPGRSTSLAPLATLAGAQTEAENSQPEPETWERVVIIQYDGGTPRQWAEALALLDPVHPPADVPPQRWLRFLDDDRQFLASTWPRQAAKLGSLDLFGCHSIAPYARHDCKGLVWSLGECGGGRLVAITAGTAVIERPTGSRQTFYRRPHAGTEVVLPWEARPSEAEEAGLPQSSTSSNGLCP